MVKEQSRGGEYPRCDLKMIFSKCNSGGAIVNQSVSLDECCRCLMCDLHYIGDYTWSGSSE